MVIGEANDRTTEGLLAITGGNEGGRVGGACGGASRVETASLSLLIARHEGGGGMQDAVAAAGSRRASDATQSRVGAAGQASGADAAVQSSAGRPVVRI
jgi:hypothetical protein